MWDVVGAVRDGEARIEWSEVLSMVGEDRLYVSVMRDAIRFDGVPAMNWHREPVKGDSRTFDGVRVPATAAEMQQIADMLFCMLPTPKILDLVWTQAALQFSPVVNLGAGKIVATQNIHDVHKAVEEKIAENGGRPPAGIIASVGKYWVVCNRLSMPGLKYGARTSCNYGWHAKSASLQAVTPGLKVYQSEGTAHNDVHVDPSQVVRLMYRMARLVRADGRREKVDLHNVAKDPVLSATINHKIGKSSVLQVLRQPSVPEPVAEPDENGILVMPETVVYSDTPPAEMDPYALAEFHRLSVT